MRVRIGLITGVIWLCSCVGVGGGEGLDDFDDGATGLDWSSAGFGEPQTDWKGFTEPDETQSSKCAKGVHPSELQPVDQGSDPDTGQMRVMHENQVVALPLAETSFDTIVLGTVADTEVRQVFENPFDEPIEAVYVFPLPNDAAVDDYAIQIADRTIRGVMKRRDEARADYERAKQAGYSAGLLEQERPNIFTQNVANIPPGEKITVVMHMVGPVHRDRGHFELALPTVVGPRYSPGTPTGRSGHGFSLDTDRVPDASRITPKVLPEGYVSCAELDVRVEIDAGSPLDVVASKSHTIDVDRSDGSAVIELQSDAELLNRDFVLGWSIATETPTTSLMLQAADKSDEGYFTLTIMPPQFEHASKPAPRELVFVLDTSGSMSGEPMATAKGAMQGFLRNLGPDDAFQVIRFSNSASRLGGRPLSSTPTNVRRALRHIDRMRGEGGTEMIEGIKAALDFPYTQGRARYVLFLTDGYIGNENEIFAEVSQRLDKARVFSLGVGSSPNRHLLDGLARAGRGAVTYVDNHESPVEAVGTFYRRLAHPVLTDIEIDWGQLDVHDVVPARIPDLFTGQPVVVYGRLDGARSGTARLVARAGDRRVEIPVRVDLAEARRTDGLASMWARAKIQELEDSLFLDPGGTARVEEAVTELALRHNVMSQYTSFVAIDDSRVVNPGGDPTTVAVPADLPEGMTTEGLGSEAVYAGAAADEPDMEMSMDAPAPAADASPLRGMPVVRHQRQGPVIDPYEVASRRLDRHARRARRAIDKCFDAASDRGLGVARVDIRVEIDSAGHITDVTFETTGIDSTLRDCLEKEVQSWRIRHPGEHAVTVSTQLSGGR